MPVASATDPSVVAGALAARVREGAEVCLSAIGVDAVGNAMRAICFARLYLEVYAPQVNSYVSLLHECAWPCQCRVTTVMATVYNRVLLCSMLVMMPLMLKCRTMV